MQLWGGELQSPAILTHSRGGGEFQTVPRCLEGKATTQLALPDALLDNLVLLNGSKHHFTIGLQWFHVTNPPNPNCSRGLEKIECFYHWIDKQDQKPFFLRSSCPDFGEHVQPKRIQDTITC